MKCSFCGHEINDKLVGIKGIDAVICKDCLKTGKEEINEIVIENNNDIHLKPHEIKTELDKYVIGQEEAKKILSVEIYNHYKRINSKISEVDIQKTNLMIAGPTGSGKTYLVETIGKILDVPVYIGDATTLTEAGYIGKDVESLLIGLYQKADGNIKAVERGIVYIDEIDKILKKGTDKKGKDPNGEGVQQALLKMIEGSEVVIEVTTSLGKIPVTINTKNILFICGGAFDGIDEIVKKRLGIKKRVIMGFGESSDTKPVESTEKVSLKIKPEDLIEYGFIGEFVGRVPLIATVTKLTENELLDILVKPKNSIIKQYEALLKIDGVHLKFNDDALQYIVSEALKKNVGARGLRGIIAYNMNEIMFKIPQNQGIKEFVVTKEYLLK